MSNYEYKVIPFMGQIKAGGSVSAIAEQLQNAIASGSKDGWELHSFNDVNIEVKPGCLSALFGAKVSYTQYDQIVFKRAVS